MDPNDEPHAKLLYALARHVLAGRKHSYEERRPGGGVEVAQGRIRFVVEVDSVEFWGTTWREVATEKRWR